MKIICHVDQGIYPYPSYYNFKYKFYSNDQLLFANVQNTNDITYLSFDWLINNRNDGIGYIYMGGNIDELFYNMIINRDKKIAILNIKHEIDLIRILCKFLIYSKFEYELEVI